MPPNTRHGCGNPVHAGFVKDLDLGLLKSLAGFLFTKPYLLHPALSEEQVLVKQTLVRGHWVGVGVGGCKGSFNLELSFGSYLKFC